MRPVPIASTAPGARPSSSSPRSETRPSSATTSIDAARQHGRRVRVRTRSAHVPLLVGSGEKSAGRSKPCPRCRPPHRRRDLRCEGGRSRARPARTRAARMPSNTIASPTATPRQRAGGHRRSPRSRHGPSTGTRPARARQVSRRRRAREPAARRRRQPQPPATRPPSPAETRSTPPSRPAARGGERTEVQAPADAIEQRARARRPAHRARPGPVTRAAENTPRPPSTVSTRRPRTRLRRRRDRAPHRS